MRTYVVASYAYGKPKGFVPFSRPKGYHHIGFITGGTSARIRRTNPPFLLPVLHNFVHGLSGVIAKSGDERANQLDPIP